MRFSVILKVAVGKLGLEFVPEQSHYTLITALLVFVSLL
jgi:hypothetical protein